jgi:phosphatidylinositol glycan class O
MKVEDIRTRWLRNVSKANLAVLLLLYITFIHLTGLYTFTRGFLLSRMAIPTVTPPYSLSSPPIIPATHKKAVVLIIDALRTDFISPHHPEPASPNHHGILTLPAELWAKDPSRSLIFNTYSDPPTTTMQRIKGITTGSLPTFIDAGANFASTAIEEDSWISQLVAADKRVVFMGDDTWVNLFPASFHQSHPFDSFNVEDLHTVDNGVVEHLFPHLAPENQTQWDVLIGHFLGVDHVGHRVGPERDTMKAKLSQMDQVLRDVVERLDDETLLVVLGDHGMDSKGNHGGDSELETAAALWLYSKGPSLTGIAPPDTKLVRDWPMYAFPGTDIPLRHVNQIDLVPTLSLLLGIPIPFNNLGLAIPQCFASNLTLLDDAVKVNAEQIMRYVEEYGDRDIERALLPLWQRASDAAEFTASLALEGESAKEIWVEWLATELGETIDGTSEQAQRLSIKLHRKVALTALANLRALWAQFSVPLILTGILALALSVPSLIALYIAVRNNGPNWDVYVRLAIDTLLLPSLGAGALSAITTAVLTKNLITAVKVSAVAFALVSELFLILPLLVQISLPDRTQWPIQRAIGPIMLFFHTIAFASNSFVMWEDRMMIFLLNTIPLIHLFKAPTAPTSSMRWTIAGGSCLIMGLVRLIGSITVCREEQQPYCHVTFYSGSTPTASPYALGAILVVALHLPRAIGMLLDFSKSLAGPAPGFLGKAWRGTMVLNAVYWILEWLESWEGLQADRVPFVNGLRLWLARLSFGSILLLLPYLWAFSGLCIQVKRDPDQTGDQKAVTVFGFANAYGSTYLIFLLIPYTLVHLVSQPMAQLALSAMLIITVTHLEVTDSQRDAILMTSSFAQSQSQGGPGGFDGLDNTGPSAKIVRPTFTDVTPLAMLGFLGFFATGHQAVLTSIQWKAAFVGFTTVTYPFSPLLVVVNTWGPIALTALAVPLLAIWNISPRPSGTIPLLAHTVQLCIAFSIYHTIITLSSAVCAAWLRRHLMVWKVFAPRFMLAGVTLLIVDLSLLVAIGVGMRVTSWKVYKTFKCVST